MAYLTPNITAGDTTRGFTIPAYMLPLIVGILLSANDEEMWEVWGDATIQECLDILSDCIAQIEGY